MEEGTGDLHIKIVSDILIRCCLSRSVLNFKYSELHGNDKKTNYIKS